MRGKQSLFLVVAALLFVPRFALGDLATPASNLAGLKQFRDRVNVTLDVKGADEFKLDPSEIIKIVRAALLTTGVTFTAGDYATPSVHIAISGESSGGAMEFRVDMAVRALMASPFAKDRSIEGIVWQRSYVGRHLVRYDPASKGLVKPVGPMNERVYDAARELAHRLPEDIKQSAIRS
jgi:hypothetical protein